MFRAVLCCALAAIVPMIARAELPASEAQAIHAVVAAQLDAFARDDGERAFSYASDAIRAQFGDAESFIRMVRSGYPVVYRPRSVHFEAPLEIDGDVIQPVRMTDADGRTWLALYPMQRQSDGGWRIDGCVLRRAAGRET